MPILKGFKVFTFWADGSSGTQTFKSQNAAKAYINGLDLTEVIRVTTRPDWSKIGETVYVEVKHQV